MDGYRPRHRRPPVCFCGAVCPQMGVKRPKRMTREMWEVLLDGLERRYQRREGVREEDLIEVRLLLRDWKDEPTVEG
jgi:hypothetical protein